MIWAKGSYPHAKLSVQSLGYRLKGTNCYLMDNSLGFSKTGRGSSMSRMYSVYLIILSCSIASISLEAVLALSDRVNVPKRNISCALPTTPAVALSVM